MENRPRAQSVLQVRPSNIQIRASKLFSKFRIRHKSKDDGPYMTMRQTNSMDVAMTKPYMSQPMLGLARDEDGSRSSQGDSSPDGNGRPFLPNNTTKPAPNQKHGYSLSAGIITGANAATAHGGRISIDESSRTNAKKYTSSPTGTVPGERSRGHALSAGIIPRTDAVVTSSTMRTNTDAPRSPTKSISNTRLPAGSNLSKQATSKYSTSHSSLSFLSSAARGTEAPNGIEASAGDRDTVPAPLRAGYTAGATTRMGFSGAISSPSATTAVLSFGPSTSPKQKGEGVVPASRGPPDKPQVHGVYSPEGLPRSMDFDARELYDSPNGKPGLPRIHVSSVAPSPLSQSSTGDTPSRRPAPPSRAPPSPPKTPTTPTTPTKRPSTSPNPFPRALTINTSTLPARRAPPRLNGLPMHRFSLTDDGTARLSPSIITRHPPMPILNLPTLPPLPVEAEAGAKLSRAQSHARLRSMPALPLRGARGEDDEGDGGEGEGEDDIEEEDEGDGEGEGEGEGEESEEHYPGRLSVSTNEDGDEGVRSPSRASSYLHSNDDEDEKMKARGREGLPSVDTSRIDLSFLDQSPLYPDFKGKGKAKEREDPETPVPGDYFTFSSSGGTARTPKASGRPGTSSTARPGTSSTTRQGRRDPSVSPAQTPKPSDALRQPSLIVRQPSVLLDGDSSGRPGLYKLSSRSMIDISGMGMGGTRRPPPVEEKSLLPSGSISKRPHPQQSESESQQPPLPDYDALHPPGGGSTLRRRRSMPTFTGSSPPPPYPSFAPYHHYKGVVATANTEEDGKEKLPEYSNSIYLRGVLPRKMEFSSPGVQAKDRKWRRVLCELEGTVFRVFECPREVVGVSAISGWWERKVGVGDISLAAAPASQKPAPPTEKVSKVGEGEGHGQTEVRIPPAPLPPSPSETRQSKLANLLRPHGRSKSDAQNLPPRLSPPVSTGRSSFSIPRTSMASSSGSGESGLQSSRSNLSLTTSNSSSGRNQRSSNIATSFDPSDPFPDVPLPDWNDLIKAYTLQNAESGLGNDYLKRKNVIRVRMEGEQFLLQAKDVGAVVEWIEGLHAATNVALDLDERPMPKGPLFPRRRRRRGARRAGEASGGGEAANDRQAGEITPPTVSTTAT